MSGTTTTRVEIPISIATGLGQDITVGIFADSGGSPTGASLGGATLPVEFVTAVAASMDVFPDQQTVWLGDWTNDVSLAPPYPLDHITGFALANDGNTVVQIGGYDVPDDLFITTVQAAPVLGAAGQAGAWTRQPDAPVALANMVAVCAAGYVVVLGGNPRAGTGASVKSVYTAPLSTAGVLGAWSPQADLPFAVTAALITASGSNVYVLGGFGTGLHSVYMGTIGTGGVITSWTKLTVQPPTNDVTWANATPTIINGWLVIVGGAGNAVYTYAKVWGSRINDDGTLGGFMPWPALPAALSDLNIYSVDNNVVVTGGSTLVAADANLATYSLAVAASGPSNVGWVTQPSLPDPGGVVSGLLNYTGGASTVVQTGTPPYLLTFGRYNYYWGMAISGSTSPVYQTPVISVPINASGLTNGAKYHIVLTGVSGTAGVNDVQVVVVSSLSGGGGFTGKTKLGAGSWTAMTSGYGVPLTVYSGTTGRIVHTEASVNPPGQWDWLLYNYWGQVIGYGNYVGNTRSFNAIQYDGSGLPVGIV